MLSPGYVLVPYPPTDKDFTDINVSNNNELDNNRQNSLSIIDKVIFQKRDTEFALIINKESSLTEIDSRADINGIQEGLIPLKYYEKLSERLTQANGEKLIINYKIPNVHICNDKIRFETVFVLIKYFSSKDTLFRFIAPSIPKEIYSLNNIDKERICRTKRHLSSLKTEISLVNRLTDNDIKKFK